MITPKFLKNVNIEARKTKLDKIKETISRIDENLGMAQNLRNESEVDAKAYDQGMTEAHEQARKVIRDTVKEISDEATRRHEEFNTKLSAEFKMAEDRISEAKVDAVASIEEAAASVTSEAIERLIGERPKDNAVRGAISLAFKEANKGPS